ncbi:MAG: hypothetical protein EXQ96_03265 [Alphaproteobacteria bacterium]|nr:hypothetical protein [Alphaproteobacteria bacterium]
MDSEMQRLLTTLRRMVSCRRGASAIDFAFSASILVAAMAGALEFSGAVFVNSAVEGALREAARFGTTGFAFPGETRADAIRRIVGERTFGMVTVLPESLTTKVYTSFALVGKGEPFTETAPANGRYDLGELFDDVNGNGQYDADLGVAGAAGEIVLYRIDYEVPVLIGLMSNILGKSAHSMTASIVVRNEPFASAGGG